MRRRNTLVVITVLVGLLPACKQSAPAVSPQPKPPPSPPSSPSPSPAKPPPVSEARVEGTFSGQGFFGATVTFKPECPTGPCDLQATSHGSALRAEFLFANGSYQGANLRPDICNFRGGPSFKTKQERSYKFSVSKAEVIEDVWTATQLRVWSRVTGPKFQKSIRHGLTTTTYTCRPIHHWFKRTSTLRR